MGELNVPIREGLVLRKGDHLIVVLPVQAMSEQVAHAHKRLKEELGPDIRVTVMGGVQQIAKIEPDDV